MPKIETPAPESQTPLSEHQTAFDSETSALVCKVLNSAPTGIMVLDERCHLIFINQYAENLLGIRADDVLQKHISRFIQDPELIDRITRGAMDGDAHYLLQDRSVLVTTRRFLERTYPQGFLLLLQRKDQFDPIEERVNRLKDEFASLLESSYDGIILADVQDILNVNASFGRITGIAPSALIGKNIGKLDTGRHICLAAVQEVLRLTRFHKRSLTLQRKLLSGNEIFLTGNPIFNRQGQMVRVLVNVRDVTDLKSLEDQIKKVTAFCKEIADPQEIRFKEFEGIVAESPAMRRLLDLVIRVARVDSTVLLQGESGVGKDVFARLIHRLSERGQKPFISVNCGAIPETLLESEFFGYEKGAFTNASRGGKAGLFEQANGGILFMDEVGDLPLNLQVKLLKVIQDRRCRRLGGVSSIDLDLRIIAATNRDLQQMVSEGNFRTDLFYRLYVVPIAMPPLRERREDILPLSLMFLNQFNKKYGVHHTLGPNLMSALEAYDWPGNVRELQNIVERMVVTADADVLAPHHLPDTICKEAKEAICSEFSETLNLKKAREILEREIIKKAVSKAGNIRKAAKLLGVDHSTVVRKAQRYGLSMKELSVPDELEND